MSFSVLRLQEANVNILQKILFAHLPYKQSPVEKPVVGITFAKSETVTKLMVLKNDVGIDAQGSMRVSCPKE